MRFNTLTAVGNALRVVTTLKGTTRNIETPFLNFLESQPQTSMSDYQFRFWTNSDLSSLRVTAFSYHEPIVDFTHMSLHLVLM